MGVVSLFIALLSFLPSVLNAQPNPSRDQRWRDDLQTLQQQINRTHPNPYTQVSRTQFETAIQQLNDAIPQLSDPAVISGMAGIVASIGDIHTSLSLTQGGTGFRFLPIRTRWFTEGLFITQASNDLGASMGRRVVQIGNKSAEDAYLAVRPLISHENDWWARLVSGNYLVSPDILLAAGVIDADGPVPYILEDAQGGLTTMNLSVTGLSLLAGPVISHPRFPLYRRNPAQYYWFDYQADADLLYVKYNSCANMNALPFPQFVQDMTQTFSETPPRKVVIDLRNNGGGDSTVIQPLLDVFQSAVRQGYPANSVYVIIGRETASSASLNTSSLKAIGTMIVGEPTGGGASGFGNVTSIVLPNSRLSISCSTRLFTVANAPGPFIAPDIAVDLTAADYFADRDPVLDRIMQQ